MVLKRTFGAGSIALLATPVLCQWAMASPVVDVLFDETLTNTCAASCDSVVLGTDPLDGVNTVEYIFNAPVPGLINAGDIKIQEFGGTSIGDVIRFENLAGIGPVAFIYSGDLGGGLPADVGI